MQQAHTNINMADWKNSESKFWENDTKAGGNIVQDIVEPNEDIPTSITINGDEWWLKFHGQHDELPDSWPREVTDDDNAMETYENITWSTLNIHLCDEDPISKEQSGNVDSQDEVREHVTRIHTQEFMTNMVRVEADHAEHGRESTEENDKIDHKGQVVETQANLGYGNNLFLDVDMVDNEMGGVPWRVDDGHHSGLFFKSDQTKSPISISDSGITATTRPYNGRTTNSGEPPSPKTKLKMAKQ